MNSIKTIALALLASAVLSLTACASGGTDDEHAEQEAPELREGHGPRGEKDERRAY